MTTAKTSLPTREDIPQKYKWNAESVFPNRDAWRAEAQALPALIEKAASYQGRITESPAALLEWLSYVESLFRRVQTLMMYAMFSSAVDSGDVEAIGMVGQAQGLVGAAISSTAFDAPEILAAGQEKIMGWVEADERLGRYRHYFDNLFRSAPHIRSAEVEAVLGMLAAPFGGVNNAYGALTGADMQFPDAVDSAGNSLPVAQSTIGQRLHSQDRVERRTAYESYTGEYLKLKHTLGGLYLTSVKQDVFNARVRHHTTALEAALFPNNVPLEVFHNLVETFRQHLPVWQRYWEVRRKALGQDDIQPYDIWAPIATEQPEVSYEQAVEWICDGMQPLGEEYVQALRRGCLEERWVDVMPNKGKRQGAFSYGAPGTYPFIMMSHDNGLGGMSTLAHELGHSMHSYLSWQNQPVLLSRYSMFVAEVASNFNQALTRAYLFEAKKDDVNFQIALIEEAMANFHRYFFIMPTLARFELDVHTRVEKGQPVTPDALNELMADLFAEGYGDTMHYDRDRIGITWATFGHLYVAYYTFQYATGISAAHALAQRVLEEGESAAQDYLAFLRAGGSMYPIDALQLAGVDMRTPQAVEQTFGVMRSMIDRLEQLIG